jgi:clan AA aspartic protease
MGRVETEITLVNIEDAALAKRGYISGGEVRKATVQAIVDTGAWSLVITEELYQKLGLAQTGVTNAKLADGRKMPCIITNDIILQCNGRETSIRAAVIPGAERVLMGVLPLELMDFMVDPANQTLVGVHGDRIECMVY